MQLASVFWAEFHPQQGPLVYHEHPRGYFLPVNASVNWENNDEELEEKPEKNQKIDFDSISEYIIPKTELCERVVSISTGAYSGMIIVGYPVVIEDARYERNAMLFNCGVVLRPISPRQQYNYRQTSRDLRHYHAIVCQLGQMFRRFELEFGLLSDGEFKLRHLPALFSELFDKLPSDGSIQLTIESYYSSIDSSINTRIPSRKTRFNHLNLKLDGTLWSTGEYSSSLSSSSSSVISNELIADKVPVFIKQIPSHQYQICEDLTMQRLMKTIDGVLTVGQIAWRANIDTSLAKQAVRHLMYFGIIRLIEPFMFRSVYRLTGSINNLFAISTDSDVIHEINEFLFDGPQQFVDLCLVLQIFSLFDGHRDCAAVDGLIRKRFHSLSLSIDIRRLVAFGQLWNFLCSS